MDDPLADLLHRVARADRRAFRTLYAEAAPKLFGLLLRMLSSRPEAEDALQEVFTRIWQRAGQYDAQRGRAMTWMIGLARHHAIDRLRRRPRVPFEDETAFDSIADDTPGAEARVLARSDALRIDDCFARLAPDRAEAVRGAYLRGLSYQDLADRHAVPLNTMRTWLRRSLLSLKECLGQ